MHVRALALVPLLLAACVTLETTEYFCCHPSYTPITADDSILGFSAEDVVALLSANLPTSVIWDQMTLGDASTDLAISLALDGEPSLAEPSSEDSCCLEDGSWLQIPLALDIVMAGGEVTASGTTRFAAWAPALDHVWIYTGWDLPAVLTGDYLAQFGAYFEDEYGSRGFTLEGTWISFARTWAEPVVDIDCTSHSADAGSAAAVWRGTWSLPAISATAADPVLVGSVEVP